MMHDVRCRSFQDECIVSGNVREPYENWHTPHVALAVLVARFEMLEVGKPAVLELEVDVAGAEESLVFCRAQLLRILLEQRALGIEPDRLGFEVSCRVLREAGRDDGAAVKALFVK